jgi:hypothetical protein
MVAGGFKMAVPHQIWQDSPDVLAGLAELARYWFAMPCRITIIISMIKRSSFHRIVINNFAPRGPLYDHLTPKSIEGLTTQHWDRKYHPGYFTIMDLNFWFTPQVQDFLSTVLRTVRVTMQTAYCPQIMCCLLHLI